jgi:hypothetical protein
VVALTLAALPLLLAMLQRACVETGSPDKVCPDKVCPDKVCEVAKGAEANDGRGEVAAGGTEKQGRLGSVMPNKEDPSSLFLV